MMRPASVWIALSSLATAAALSLMDIVSWDYWWMLRTGQLIAETGAVPRVDPYSYTAAGAPYVDIHWLFQLGLYGLHCLGGHAAVVIGKLVLVALVLALIAQPARLRSRPTLCGLVVGFVLVVCAERIMPRPELASFVLLAAVHAVLLRDREKGDGWLWLVVPLQVLWANLHGLFALGIALCAIELAGELLEWLGRRRAQAGEGEGTPPGRRRAWRLAGITAAAAVAAFVSPNGLRGALYPVAQLGMIGARTEATLGSDIVELQPSLAAAHPLVLLAAALIVGGAAHALWLDRRRARAADVLALLAFLYLGIAARRNLPLLAIVSAPILVIHLSAYLDAKWGAADVRRRGQTAALVGVVLIALAADVGSGRFHLRLGIPREAGLGIMQTWYSLGAADWLAAHPVPGPIAHHMADGGVLIYRLHPGVRVMVDGRLEVYGPERLQALRIRGPRDFRRLDERYRFGSVLVHYSKVPSAPLLAFLQRSDAWTLVFVDEVSALYVRSDAARAHGLAAVDLAAPDLFPPLEDAGRVQTELRARGQALFLAAMDRRGRARRVMREASRLHPEIVWGAEQRSAGAVPGTRPSPDSPQLLW